VHVTPRDQLDPDVAEVFGAFDLEFNAETLPSIRFGFDVPTADDVERVEHAVPGDPPAPIHVHRPTGADGPLPCIYSIHGGGYIVGDPSMDFPMFNDLCPELGVVGVTIDYRLAPEHPYPAAIEDCYRGLLWTFEHAEELGIDPTRIGVHGLSAGGGLAAALTLLVRDRGDVQLAFQALDSPMLDDRQITPSSQQDGLPVWSRTSNRFGWESYLGDLYGGDVPYTAAPARATDLSGLPPAFISVGAIDGFRDETIDYATRLMQANVPTELHVYPSACHGYQAVEHAAVSRQSARDRNDWLARATRSR
jgi:acetyl esterase/lipase